MNWEAACLPGNFGAYCSGIGAEAAATAARRAVAEGAEILVSFGSAAGLNPAIVSGTLLVTDQVRGTDTNIDVSLAAHWQQIRAILEPLEPLTGVIVQATKVLSTVSHKTDLYRQTGAQAADMESAAIAEVARELGCAFGAIRVVLDDANTVMPAALVDACDAYGGVRPAAMALTLLRQPGLVGVLPRLARAQRQATKTLSAAARLLAVRLAGRLV